MQINYEGGEGKSSVKTLLEELSPPTEGRS
nr:MAG TPA: hypothetical protein [Caudoviricetes sp.]